MDPKTVQRWLAGRIPYPRHRWALADLLGLRDEVLWPEADVNAIGARSVTGELLAAYAHRADVPLSVWQNLLDRAHDSIDMLAYAMLQIPEQHINLASIFQEKAKDGCQIRMLLGDPDCFQVKELDKEERFDGVFLARVRTTITYFRELPEIEGVQLRYHATPLYSSIYRYDNEMLMNPHLYGNHAWQSPVFHFRRVMVDGIFDNYLNSFERVWALASEKPSGSVQRKVAGDGED